MRTDKNKGITLIALVITIIVLLILAGITIASITGEKGIIKEARTAKELSEKAALEEQVELAIIKAEEKYKNPTIDDVIEELKNNKVISKNDQVDKETGSIITDAGYEIAGKLDDYIGKVSIGDGDTSEGEDKPPIPEKFYHAGGTIEEGFVISDVKGDNLNNSLHGNQFVWVPVDINNFRQIEGYYDNNLDTMLSACHEPSQEGYRYNTEEAEYNAMKKSVEDSGGFYIGRYEAGKDTNGNVIVQKGATVYNEIPWGTSMTNITGGAVEKAKNFTKGKTYEGKVTSTLIYGVQWDATMQFMDSKYLTGTCAEDSYVRNSEGKGWYSTEEDQKKGPTETGYYEYKHIFDMAGNVGEWTMEAYENDCRVTRAGRYYNAGSIYPASVHVRNYPDYHNDYIGFRLALYL